MLQVLEKGLVKERSSLSEAVIETGNGVLREGGAVTESRTVGKLKTSGLWMRAQLLG